MTRIPWQSRSPQRAGRDTEKAVLKSMGVLAHPMSGAGRIKADGSDERRVVEVKYTEKKQFPLKHSDLETIWKLAVRQGKDPVFVVEFSDGLRATIEVSR